MRKSTCKESITAGPFSIHFTNVNREMELRGHSHFAEVYFQFETIGSVGFPSFEHTHAEIQQQLKHLTHLPFRDATNEEVLRRLFDHFSAAELEETKKYSCAFRLTAMELHVRGVPDAIGHADAFTRYRIES